MTPGTVAQLRAVAASRAAVRQYRLAARRHQQAADELMTRGEYGYAGEYLVMADMLGAAALAEKLGEPR